MVFHATVGNHEKVMIARDSCHIGPEHGLRLLRDEFFAAFGAEYDVKVIVHIAVGHRVSAPPGLPSYI